MQNLRTGLEIIFTLIIFLLLLLLGYNINTTGDTGDSIVHYLYAHYSFTYPHFFFHHWAKPVFVLLSSPFSQFGFNGIIFFNCLCASLTILLTFYSARNLKIKNEYLVFIFVLSAPLYFKMIFSGLTEYLFALFLIAGIYFYTSSRNIIALIIISFLPLVRSEGLLILGVFGIQLLIKRDFKLIPLLSIGHLVFAFAGSFYHQNLLWVFTKIPYANLGSPYGRGELFDFVHRLNYVIEKPIYFLMFVGILTLLYSLFKSKLRTLSDPKTILILGSFTVFFIAHSLFWWLGIFNSMGLPRVLIGVVPLIALLSLTGVETISTFVKNPILRKTILLIVTVTVCLYPFRYRSKGIVYNENLFTIQDNNLIDEELMPFINKNLTSARNSPYYFTYPYFSLSLKVDYFNPDSHRSLRNVLTDSIPNESIIVWDSWYSVVEDGIKLEQLKNDNRFTLIKSFERYDSERKINFAIFKKNS